MTFGVYIAGFQVIFGSKGGFLNNFVVILCHFYGVEGLCRGDIRYSGKA